MTGGSTVSTSSAARFAARVRSRRRRRIAAVLAVLLLVVVAERDGVAAPNPHGEGGLERHPGQAHVEDPRLGVEV